MIFHYGNVWFVDLPNPFSHRLSEPETYSYSMLVPFPRNTTPMGEVFLYSNYYI